MSRLLANNGWKKLRLWNFVKRNNLFKTDHALRFAKQLFLEEGLMRRDGRRGFIHSYRTPQIGSFFLIWEEFTLQEWDIILAAMALHDVIEDASISLLVIRNAFGYEVADIVDAVTQRPGESKTDYLNRAFASLKKAIVKTADRIHNVRNMTKHIGKSGFREWRLVRYIKETEEEIIPRIETFISKGYRGTLFFLYVELLQSVDDAKSKISWRRIEK